MFKHFFNKVGDKLVSKKQNRDFSALIANLINAKHVIGEIDLNKSAAIVCFGSGLNILIASEPKRNTVQLETGIVFDSTIMNLKTMSSIAHSAMSYGFAISGVTPLGDGNSKMYVGKEIDWNSAHQTTSRELKRFKKLVVAITDYINLRQKQKQIVKLDISMFSKVDLKKFNPRDLGEKKDFVYTSWQKFADTIVEGVEDYRLIENKIEELKACAEFEHNNKMMLSEIGDVVLSELHFHDGFSTKQKESKFNVN